MFRIAGIGVQGGAKIRVFGEHCYIDTHTAQDLCTNSIMNGSLDNVPV